jgi:hypothetical protein
VSEADAFLALGLVATAVAASWDALSGEFMPAVNGVLIGLILGVMLFG